MERHGKSSIHSVRNKSSYNKNKRDSKIPITCKYCGKNHKPRECPAFGRICKKCHKKNHFAKVCKSPKTKKDYSTEQDQKRSPTKKIHQVVDVATEPDSDQDDFYSPTYAFK